MANRSLDPDSLLDVVDFRAFFETLRLRWWVIPAVVAVAVGFLWAQESDLRVEPDSYLLKRSYAVRDLNGILGAARFGIGEVQEFPEESFQLRILSSAETRDEISKQLGGEVMVELPDNFKSPFTLNCSEPQKQNCSEALDLYIQKLAELRREAISKNLAETRNVLQGVYNTTGDSSLPSRIATIDVLLEQIDTTPRLLDSYEETEGKTITEVAQPTYTLGIVAGLVIALLILLQLSISDNRIRSARQLIRLVGSEWLLGNAYSKPTEVSDRRAAISIHRALEDSSAVNLRFIPIRREILSQATVTRLAEMAGGAFSVTQPFALLSVHELAKKSEDETDVMVVQRNRDLRRDVYEAFVALRRSGRPFAGVLLID